MDNSLFPCQKSESIFIICSLDRCMWVGFSKNSCGCGVVRIFCILVSPFYYECECEKRAAELRLFYVSIRWLISIVINVKHSHLQHSKVPLIIIEKIIRKRFGENNRSVSFLKENYSFTSIAFETLDDGPWNEHVHRKIIFLEENFGRRSEKQIGMPICWWR